MVIFSVLAFTSSSPFFGYTSGDSCKTFISERPVLGRLFGEMANNDASHDPSSEWTNLCEVCIFGNLKKKTSHDLVLGAPSPTQPCQLGGGGLCLLQSCSSGHLSA